MPVVVYRYLTDSFLHMKSYENDGFDLHSCHSINNLFIKCIKWSLYDELSTILWGIYFLIEFITVPNNGELKILSRQFSSIDCILFVRENSYPSCNWWRMTPSKNFYCRRLSHYFDTAICGIILIWDAWGNKWLFQEMCVYLSVLKLMVLNN